jgi:hypothetical protein
MTQHRPEKDAINPRPQAETPAPADDQLIDQPLHSPPSGRPGAVDPRPVTMRDLHHLQRVVGNRAVGRLLAPPGQRLTIQRELEDVQSENLPTPAQAIKDRTGVAKTHQSLPGGDVQPATKRQRPRRVKAKISKATIRKQARKDSAALAPVTAMARAEQHILQGADIKKFYDAGHLVADQLVAGDNTNSFTSWNLAPQVSEFNTPVYSKVEEEIKASAGASDVEMEVEVAYPADYAVTVGHLVGRGIIAASPQLNLQTQVQIPRRVPNKWMLKARNLEKPSPALQPTAKQIGAPKVALGTPYQVVVQTSFLPGPDSTLIIQDRTLIALQWAPPPAISNEDVVSLLTKTFPDLGDQESIVKRLVNDSHQIIPQQQIKLMKEAAGDVALALSDVVSTMSDLRDPSQSKQLLDLMQPRIANELKLARIEAMPFAEAAGHLITAHSWVDDLKEQLEALKEHQQQEFPFTLTQEHELAKQVEASHEAWNLSFSLPVSEPAMMLEEKQVGTSAQQPAKDFTGTHIKHLANTDGRGGELRMFWFTDQAPVQRGDRLLISNSPPTIVEAVDCTRSEGIATIVYKHLGT